ncbi:MAG TPA: phosphoglucosamine mutase [Candidatus Polarisedimenticolaceae bacterium]|nr:phosphoglucosamine mutase [Candidatus Polarisedimenticolaceae bacterium]
MKRLFGTDGIRAVAGDPPLDPPTVRKFGAALATVLGRGPEAGGRCRVVLGRDTRESGPSLRDAVVAGLAARRAVAVDAGVITTPGLAHVVLHGGFDAGVMISASHNPFEDNGLKAFGRDGFKLPDDTEQQIERLMLDGGLDDPGEAAARVEADPLLLDEYVRSLERAAPNRLDGLDVVLDCANGAASAIAPELFRRRGARVTTLATEPDGRNINLDCGSLHLERLGQTVRRSGADLGLAFDGDADRCLAVDRRGRTVDGDHILYLAGCRMKRNGTLRRNALVATIMSNFWLEERLGFEGIGLHRAPVGDKYVLERMIREDLVLGGEQSGHVIFRDHASTGDGILTGLLLLDAVTDGPPLEQVMDGIEPYPQVLINVRVKSKPDLDRHARIGPAGRRTEAELDGHGRVVLRYSGTEPKARVMVEGKHAETVRRLAESLSALIEEELG